MQYFLHFFTFFLHFSAKIGAFLFIPPNTPHTHLQPQPSQTQPKRPRKSQPKAMRSVFLGRRANRALLPRCVPSFCRSRRAIRCETPCGTPSLRSPRRRAECSVSGEARSRSSALRLSLRSSLACSDMPRCALVPAHAPLRRSIFPRLSVRLRPVSLLASDFRRSRSRGSPPCSAAAQSRHYGRGGLYRHLGRMRPLMGAGSGTRPLAVAVLACRQMAFGACGAICLMLS